MFRNNNNDAPPFAGGPPPPSSSAPPPLPPPTPKPRGFASSSRGGGGDDDDDDDENNLFATARRRTRDDDDDGDDDDDDDVLLSSFANLDHRRARRTGFPEAVFGQGKTPGQVHAILDSMARNARDSRRRAGDGGGAPSRARTIIATRVDRGAYDALAGIGPLSAPGATMEYHEAARIVSVRLLDDDDDGDGEDDDDPFDSSPPPTPPPSPYGQSVVVACAGTTDLPVAEEAAVTLELSGVRVDRVYDCGVAGLHRILSALPRLRHEDVGCVVVCAGMDGALPSVVGGLVDVPVVAVPTSVGYGASLGGVSALLTMLNSCSPEGSDDDVARYARGAKSTP